LSDKSTISTSRDLPDDQPKGNTKGVKIPEQGARGQLKGTKRAHLYLGIKRGRSLEDIGEDTGLAAGGSV